MATVSEVLEQLPEYQRKDGDFLEITAYHMLSRLEEFYVDKEEFGCKTEEELDDFISELLSNEKAISNNGKFYRQITADNSYNSSTPVTYEIRVFTDSQDEWGTIYTALSFHRWGDVRGNYTDWVVFKIAEDVSEHEWFMYLVDAIEEAYKGYEFELNGRKVIIDQDLFTEEGVVRISVLDEDTQELYDNEKYIGCFDGETPEQFVEWFKTIVEEEDDDFNELREALNIIKKTKIVVDNQ